MNRRASPATGNFANWSGSSSWPWLSSAEEVARVVVGVFQGRPVYLSEVAEVRERVGLFTVDRPVRDMILEQASERAIRDYAIENGMDTLQQDGLQKVGQGVTSVEEFKRVLRF